MSKRRVSLTLDEELVKKIDRSAEADELNRSQKVEDIVENHFKNQGLNTAVVLCGDPELKSLELYEGRSILAYILENFSEHGISRVILLTGPNREEIEKEFGKSYKGVNIEYFAEEKPEGTAKALEKTKPELNSSFLVVNGHVIAEVDIDEMFRHHNQQEALATMALTTVENPSDYGVAQLKGHKILGFEEKPETGHEPSRLINVGTYILEPEIFSVLDHSDLEKVFEDLASEGDLSGYIYGGEWSEVDE